MAVLWKDAQPRGAVASTPMVAVLVSFVSFTFGGIVTGLGLPHRDGKGGVGSGPAHADTGENGTRLCASLARGASRGSGSARLRFHLLSTAAHSYKGAEAATWENLKVGVKVEGTCMAKKEKDMHRVVTLMVKE